MEIDVDDELLAQLRIAAARDGLEVEAYVINTVREASRPRATAAEIANAVASALLLARELPSGSTFILKELAQDKQWWNDIRAKDHNRIGTAFRPAAELAGLVTFIEKTPQNAAHYVRTDLAN